MVRSRTHAPSSLASRRCLALIAISVSALVTFASSANASDPDSMKYLLDRSTPSDVTQRLVAGKKTDTSRGKNAPPGTQVGEKIKTEAELKWEMAPSDGFSTLSATSRYVIDTADWANVRGAKSSYTVGLARDEWGFDRAVGYPNEDANWYFGYVKGSVSTPVERCLWLGTPSISPSTNPAERNCHTTGSLIRSDYMVAYNGRGCPVARRTS